MAVTPEHKCFVCDKANVHRLGVHNCPDVRVLIDEGLAAYTPEGRLMRPDGGALPRGVLGGGVAKALRDEHASSSTLKGKGQEECDPPPHMATIVGLQSHGRDLFDDNVYGVSSLSAM